jgi:hypothetical protein
LKLCDYFSSTGDTFSRLFFCRQVAQYVHKNHYIVIITLSPRHLELSIVSVPGS